ncbi:DMT family transporter [Acinetobacter radioresistens]|jgi:drug/metabolite transporter (DMT)-like permease|uniref:DMT family transporter n=1 Tax=Acinetobacter radioresistens TaxID=40216 RepID=UPI0002E4761A|nr:DMT family transporter [Acinetobacter radioresistens]MCK4091884.1 DMT family transporter [Acinetobacter radioresistens]
MNFNQSFKNFIAPEIVLVFVTMIWGGTFLAVHYILNYTTPMFFVGCRFLIAGFILLFFTFKQLKNINKNDLIAGILIGGVLAFSYGLQTIGLKTITSSESAFLTALYIPLVPILIWIFYRKLPNIFIWIGVFSAFIGLILLTGNSFNGINFNSGQIYTLLSAIGIALEIILISKFAGKVNLKRVTVIQLLGASIFCFLFMPFVGETELPDISWQFIVITVGLGFASTLIQFSMNWAQRTVDPSRAAIIYAGEPVWAAIFGRLAGERLPFLAIIGGVFVILGVLISELKPKTRTVRDSIGN